MTEPAAPVARTRHRDLRLTHGKDIQLVFKTGKSVFDPHLKIIFRKTELAHPRLCIQVSRKVSKKAVHRNRIRRRTREALSGPLARCGRGLDMVVLARRSVMDMPWNELAERTHKLLSRVLAS